MTSPIRLLAVTHSAALGGNQLHMAELLKHFLPAEIDIDVMAVVVPESGPFSFFLEQNGLTTATLPMPVMSRLYSPRVMVQEARKFPCFARQFGALLQKTKPDIVYASSHRSAIVVEPIVTRYHVPLVWQMSEFIKAQPWHRLAIHRIICNASAIVAISNATREAIIELGAPTQCVKTISEGITLEDYNVSSTDLAQFRMGLSIKPESPLIVMVGWIQQLKGWHVLVEAIPFVRSQFPDARFLFVGDCIDAGSKNYQLQLRMRLIELGQVDAVIWLGYRTDIPLILSACDLVLQTSIEPETLGVTVLQAMAAAKPIICSNLGALPEINVDGETGVVIPPGQPVELAQAIMQLLGNADLRTRMGVKGRERVNALHTKQKQVASYLELFREIACNGDKNG